MPNATHARLAREAFVAFVASAVLAGCSNTSPGPAPPRDSSVDAAGLVDAAGSTWSALLAHDWAIDPGVETYFCVRQTLAEDMWIRALRPIAPSGTHHVTLGFGEPSAPDGVVQSPGTPGAACDGFTTLGPRLVFFGGVGTGELAMPDGVALKIPAGQQILLNVHLFNASTDRQSGHSGIDILRGDPLDVAHQAEVVMAGSVTGLSVPPGPSTTTGTCIMAADETIFAVAPHMHFTGTHMKTTAVPAVGPPTTVLDEDFHFEKQTYTLLDPPLLLRKGEKLSVVCDYENPGSKTLGFGESSNQEMCFTFTYRYPAVSTLFLCAD